MRPFLFGSVLLINALGETSEPLPLFLYPGLSLEKEREETRWEEANEISLIDELTDYLEEFTNDSTIISSITSAVDIMEHHGESPIMWHYIGDRLASILPLDDPLLGRIDQLRDHDDLTEEQLLSGGTGIRGLIRTLIELRIAARTQALQKLNSTGTDLPPDVLQNLWRDPYKLLKGMGGARSMSGSNSVDVYCKSFGQMACMKALKYGLGTNSTNTTTNAPTSTSRVSLSSILVQTDATTRTTAATNVAGAGTTNDADRFVGQVHAWPPFAPLNNTAPYNGYPFYPGFPPYMGSHHALYPPILTPPPPPVETASAPRISLNPIIPTSGMISPIILAPPPETRSHKGLLKTTLMSPLDTVKRHFGADHHHSHHNQPLTYIYPLPVSVTTEQASQVMPEAKSASGRPSDYQEPEKEDTRFFWQRFSNSDTPIYDGIIKRGNRFNHMTDAIAEVPVVGPAAVFLNEAANLGRDAMLSAIEVANNLQMAEG